MDKVKPMAYEELAGEFRKLGLENAELRACVETMESKRDTLQSELKRFATIVADGSRKLTEVEKRERYMEDALHDIAAWREGCWDHDEDVGHERRDFPDEENWKMVEGVAARALTMCYPPATTPKEPLVPKSKSQQRRLPPPPHQEMTR